MLMTHLLVTVAAFSLLIPTAETEEERETGVKFSTELQPPGGPADERDQQLLATGCREKFWINVYAYGVYLDHVGAYAKLSQMVAGGAAVKLSRKDVQRINDPAIARGLRLVMVREINAEDLREAFEDELTPRLIDTFGEPKWRKENKAHLATFRNYFADDVADGTELVFVWRPGVKQGDPGGLSTTIAGKTVGSIPSSDLAWALFDCYVGDSPVSKDDVETMAKELPDQLRAGRKATKVKGRKAGG